MFWKAFLDDGRQSGLENEDATNYVGMVKIKPNLLVLYLSDKRYLKTTKKKKSFEFVTARFLQKVFTIYSLIHARLSFKDNGGREGGGIEQLMENSLYKMVHMNHIFMYTL